jgi:hypothetical protein
MKRPVPVESASALIDENTKELGGLPRGDARPPKMNLKNPRSSAVTVPAISPASAIIHQKLWQKLEEHRGGGEREPGGLQKRSRATRRARESSGSLEAGRAPT